MQLCDESKKKFLTFESTVKSLRHEMYFTKDIIGDF